MKSVALLKGNGKKKYDVVRISIADKEYLEARAKSSGTDMAKYLRKLIAEDRKRIWFEEAKAAEQALRKDKRSWKRESQERKIWDSLLLDGADQT